MSETTDPTIETILSEAAAKTVPSRREFPRFAASYPILLETDQAGIGGVTVNIARSGMLARVTEPVTGGTACEVTFLPRTRYGAELIDCPHCGSSFPVLDVPDEPVAGTIVRVEREDSGFVVAIMFAKPLKAMGEVDE